ncbi:MAG: hypothetical protein V8R49_09990 [Duodenibacillus massiliensis]
MPSWWISITRRSFKTSCKDSQSIFEGMGKVFTSTVGLICCAELFALGLTKLGGISTLIQLAASQEGSGLFLMLFIMLAIMIIATVVRGQGTPRSSRFRPCCLKLRQALATTPLPWSFPCSWRPGFPAP